MRSCLFIQNAFINVLVNEAPELKEAAKIFKPQIKSVLQPAFISCITETAVCLSSLQLDNETEAAESGRKCILSLRHLQVCHYYTLRLDRILRALAVLSIWPSYATHKNANKQLSSIHTTVFLSKLQQFSLL